MGEMSSVGICPHVIVAHGRDAMTEDQRTERLVERAEFQGSKADSSGAKVDRGLCLAEWKGEAAGIDGAETGKEDVGKDTA